jgi:flavin reductase (DIM6/NTAB) family NADH-FMN oxidoreductase RutF
MTDGLNPDPDLPDAFREAFRRHPAGAVIISADEGGQPVTLTLSSLISVSMAPPTVAFSLSAKSSNSMAIRRSKSLVIHFLRREDMPLAKLCASSGPDRLGPGINWTRFATGEPRYTDACVWFRARIVNKLAVAGASLIVVELLDGQVNTASLKPAETSLVYLNRRWHDIRRQI